MNDEEKRGPNEMFASCSSLFPVLNIKHKKLKIKTEERIVLERGAKEALCPNCGKKGPHFVPPSLGEQGFFLCDKEE